MIATLSTPRVARVRRGVVRCRVSLPLRPRPAMSRKRESPYTTRLTIALPPALSAALRAASDKYDVAVAVLARGAIERGVKLERDARRKQARHNPRHPARHPGPRASSLTRAPGRSPSLTLRTSRRPIATPRWPSRSLWRTRRPVWGRRRR